jgi:ferredoxin-type protein NapH
MPHEEVAMARIAQLPARQRTRKALLYVSLLFFPVTLYYFSPYLIIMAAGEGILSGSAIVFGLMFVSALMVGRLWCGWACPAGALQEFAAPINDRPAANGRWNLIKWLAVWVPWMAVIVWTVVRAGGIRAVDPLYQLESGVTLLQPFWFMIYYIVILLFLGLAVVVGRRAGCHYLCWMAPFMILGRTLRNRARWPALRLAAASERCTKCGRCTAACPMSLPVVDLVQRGDMEHAECILCANCTDTCPRDVIQLVFHRG